MVRRIVTALGMLLVALPLAPPAGAAAGVLVVVQDATVRCLVSADDVKRGGGPIVVCERADSQPWGMSPWETSKFNNRLNLAVVRGTGELYWERGSVPAPGEPTAGDAAVGAGQTYRANGWTIEGEGFRTRITNDATKHGILVNEGVVRQF